MTEATIELDCPACRARLRIPAGIVPPQIRCPACGETFRGVAPADAGTDANAGMAGREALQNVPRPEPEWYLRTPEGLAFGPVSRATIERWVHEGRVTGECHLRQETDSEWSLAETRFAALRSPVSPSTKPMSSPSSPSAPPVPASAAPLFAQLLPHRGPLILTLALVGLLVQCPIFSVMAWVMGSTDLEEMARGRMDPSGASITRAGRALGLILSLFWIIMAVILVAGLIFVVAVQAAPLSEGIRGPSNHG